MSGPFIPHDMSGGGGVLPVLAYWASLYGLTFAVVLPVLCRTWPHSVYGGRGGAQLDTNDEDDSSAQESLGYLQGLPPRRDHSGPAISLLVTVVTVRREGQHYLSRVVARLHRLTAADDSVGILICNVDAEPDKHREALDLGEIYPVISRRQDDGPKPGDLIEKEKEDYVFCLNVSRERSQSAGRPDIVILEDDALPREDFLPVTRHFLKRLKMSHPDFLYLKLFHPERLQGFLQPEPWRWAEWLALSTLLALTSTSALERGSRTRNKRPSSTFLLFLVYYVLLTGGLGRQNTLIPLRRWLSAYSLLSATECCTPAMAYTHDSAGRAAGFLSSVTCRRGWAKDAALYDHVRTSSELAFVLEPNLVRHIGLHSTLLRRDFP